MSDLDHRVGVSEANLVVRHLKLVGITEDNIEAIIAGIDGTFDVVKQIHTTQLSSFF